MLDTGDNVDRYTVERLLGEGGMADVYRVRHRTLGTPSALKVLRLNSRHVQERLVQEGQVQAGLRHPNIVEVRDVLEVSGHPALLLELVEGPSLEALLLRGRLPLDEAESVFLGILAAVEHAHAQGLVHRDLKPGNVLMAPRPGGGWVPKVADFGLARLVQDDDATLRKTRSGVAMGTPRYMSPEQIRDAKNVDQRTDIFALGAILYELVCGEAAFEREDIAAIFNATLSGSYKSPASLAPGVPERVLRAIDGSLKVRKSQRIPDCPTLRAVLGGAPYVGPVVEGEGESLPASTGTIVSAETIDPGPAVSRPQRTATPSMLGAAVVGGGVVAFGMGILSLVVLAGAGWWLLRAPAHDPGASTGDGSTAAVEVGVAGEAPVPGVSPATQASQPGAAPSSPGDGAPSSPGEGGPSTTSSASPSPATTPPPSSRASTVPPGTAAPASPSATAAPSTPPATSAAATSPPAPTSPTPTVATSPRPAATPVEADTVVENAAAGARVSYSGDAVKVWLVSAGKSRVARGTVPAGRYDLEADFGDGVRTPAGELDLAVGDEVALKCSRAFKRCKR